MSADAYSPPSVPLILFPMPLSDGDATPAPTFTGIALGADGNLYTATGTGKWKKATLVQAS